MVGMSVFKCIGNNYLGAIMADISDQFSLVLLIIAEKAVGHLCIVPHFNAH